MTAIESELDSFESPSKPQTKECIPTLSHFPFYINREEICPLNGDSNWEDLDISTSSNHETEEEPSKNYISKFFSNSNEDEGAPEQCPPNVSDDPEELCLSQEIDREFSMSQVGLDLESIPIEPFFNITSRSMPISPHRLIEENFKENPWAMLVATIFLTKTAGKVCRPYMKRFFSDFPTPYDVLNVEPQRLEAYFKDLGLLKRAHMIWRMSYEFVSAKWSRVSDLCGIGKYGEDAYRIFCLGHTDVEPTDRYLRLYLNWLRTQTDFLEEWSRDDCEDPNPIVDPVSDYYAITIK